MFSLLHSGLVGQAELRPGRFSLHVNLGIPAEFKGHLPSEAQAWELQQALLPHHTSADRLRRQEWVVPVTVQGQSEVSGDACGRVELRVHDVHDMWVYALLQKAPEAAHLWLADHAEREGIQYTNNQTELAAQWCKLKETVGFEIMDVTDPGLLRKKSFKKGRHDGR